MGLEEKQRLFPLTVVQIPLQQGWYLQQAFLPSKITAQNTAFSYLHSEDPIPCPIGACRHWTTGLLCTHLSLGTGSTQHLGSSQLSLRQGSPHCPGSRFPKCEMEGVTFAPAKYVEVSKLNACVIYAELTRLFVLSHVAQIPALVSTKHYSCARSSFKSLIPMGLLTCACIPRLCV